MSNLPSSQPNGVVVPQGPSDGRAAQPPFAAAVAVATLPPERGTADGSLRPRIGTWHWVPAHDRVVWSAGLFRVFERDPALPLPRFEEHLQIYTPSSRARLAAAVANALETGEPFNLELEILLADGKTRWIAGSGEAEFGPNGEVEALRGTAMDITQQKRDAERMTLSEARYRSLVRATADIVAAGRLDGSTMELAEVDEFRAFTGLTAEQTAYGGWAAAIHPDDAEATLRQWQEAVTAGKMMEMEYRLRRADGVYRTMVVRAAPVRADSGEILEWVSTLTDVTERRAAEQAQREQAALLDLSHDTILVCDLDGKVRFWNRAAERLYGYSRQEALGKISHDLLRTVFPRPLAEIRASLLREERWEGELIQTAHNGTSLVVSSRWSLQRNANGEPTGILKTHNDVTGRKRAEDENRRLLASVTEERDRLSALISSITDEVWFASANGTFTWANPAALREFGIESADGLSIQNLAGNLEILQPDGNPRSPEDAPPLRALRGEIVRELEEIVRTPRTGELRHRQISSAPVRDAAGNIIGSISVVRDITEGKAAEKALRDSQSRFRKLFESDLMGIAIPDRFGAFHEGNDEFLRIVGYTREDLEAGRVRWDVMTPPEYQALDAEHIAEAARRGSCTPYEKEYIRKDGTRVPILCGYALLEGSEDLYIGFIQDLSPQKAAEAATQEREERFRVLAETLPELVWIRDSEGAYLYCNQRLMDYVGHTREWLQTNAFDAVHPDDVARTIAKWKRCLATGEIYENQYRLRRHDGTYRYFLVRGVPIRDESGRIMRWLGCSTDIHEQKLAEEALRRSEKLATAGRLAASMAHEINNPLAAVVNTLYLALQDQKLSDDTRELLQSADRELARVAQFVTQTLRFHKQSTAPEDTDLGKVMDAVLAMYAPRLKLSKIQLERDYRTSPALRCYSSEMRQVFANLIGNALDAIGKEGSIRVRIRPGTGWQGAGHPGIRLVVADTGAGIPPEMRAHLFEPFASTKEATGVGLGLWVSHSIVRKHHGRIAFRTSSGPERQGTVFSLFFPFVQPD